MRLTSLTLTVLAALLPVFWSQQSLAGVISGLNTRWQFNEITGNAVDSIDSTRTTDRLYNVTRGQAGIEGNAYRFSGNGGVSIYSAPFDVRAGDFTLGSWLNTTTPGGVVSYFYGQRVLYGITMDSSGRVEAQARDYPLNRVDLAGSVNLADGEWHYVAFSRAGSTWSLYTDGVLISQSTAGLGLVAQTLGGSDFGSNWFRVGGLFTGPNNSNDPVPRESFYTGLIDDVQLYTRALSASEIATNYTSAIPEPASLGLMFLSLAWLAGGRRRPLRSNGNGV